MIQGFTFENNGRTYVCTIEERTAVPAGMFWWFAVTNDQQRYSAFEAISSDTQKSVKARIVAFYENLLRVRAEPVVPRNHFSRGRPPAAAKAAAAAVENDED